MAGQTLTPKQEAFAQAYVETGNASEAYRRSYDAANMRPEALHVEASRLLADPKVSLRIAHLRKVATEATQVTLTSHLRKLAELRNRATTKGQFAAAISAEIGRGKVAGLYDGQPQQYSQYSLEERLHLMVGLLKQMVAQRTLAIGPGEKVSG